MIEEPDEPIIACVVCGEPTGLPPDEWREKFAGFCPGCLVRTKVLAVIEDEELRALTELMMEQAIEHAKCPKFEVKIVALSEDGSIDVGEMLKIMVAKGIMNDETRRMMKEVIDHVEAHKDGRVPEKAVIDKPIVRNDPRTG